MSSEAERGSALKPGMDEELESVVKNLSNTDITKEDEDTLHDAETGITDDKDVPYDLDKTPNPDAEGNSDYETPSEGEAEEELLDDLVDEEKLKEAESAFSEEQLAERFEKAKTHKEKGNDEFGHGNYRDSILTYTKGLLICPLKEKDLRSVLYSNRAAAKIKLGLKGGAIQDCTQALENKPEFVRPLLRRAKLYEETEKLDEALVDYQKILVLDPSVRDAAYAVQRLPAQINERNEKLKTEMLGKLKDLGNMVLKPFGLSTENFKLQQDPNSGGYSVNFTK